MSHEHDIGDSVRLQAVFRDHDGTLTTPTTTTLKIKDPSGNVETVANGSLSTGTTGVKYYDYTVDEAGQWWFRFEASGNIVAVEEKEFQVKARQVTS